MVDKKKKLDDSAVNKKWFTSKNSKRTIVAALALSAGIWGGVNYFSKPEAPSNVYMQQATEVQAPVQEALTPQEIQKKEGALEKALQVINEEYKSKNPKTFPEMHKVLESATIHNLNYDSKTNTLSWTAKAQGLSDYAGVLWSRAGFDTDHIKDKKGRFSSDISLKAEERVIDKNTIAYSLKIPGETLNKIDLNPFDDGKISHIYAELKNGEGLESAVLTPTNMTFDGKKYAVKKDSSPGQSSPGPILNLDKEGSNKSKPVIIQTQKSTKTLETRVGDLDINDYAYTARFKTYSKAGAFDLGSLNDVFGDNIFYSETDSNEFPAIIIDADGKGLVKRDYSKLSRTFGTKESLGTIEVVKKYNSWGAATDKIFEMIEPFKETHYITEFGFKGNPDNGNDYVDVKLNKINHDSFMASAEKSFEDRLSKIYNVPVDVTGINVTYLGHDGTNNNQFMQTLDGALLTPIYKLNKINVNGEDVKNTYNVFGLASFNNDTYTLGIESKTFNHGGQAASGPGQGPGQGPGGQSSSGMSGGMSGGKGTGGK